MKIAICMYPLNDLGGIINHTEQLIAGFQDLGHEATLFEMVWREKAPSQRKDTSKGGWMTGYSGLPVHQGKGWNFPAENRIAYKDSALPSAIQKLEEFDLIIWTTPVPTKIADHRGNVDWIDLYGVNVPQVGIIHDGNALAANAHILEVKEAFKGLACVHACAMKGASFLPIPRAMILNPQDPDAPHIPGWDVRSRGFVSMQTFKGWKRVHELVEAIAYMPPRVNDEELRHIAGEGIEYRYMASPDKCKPQYFHPDNGEWPWSGKQMWYAALDNGMQRPPNGYWNSHEVRAMLSKARVLVDPSWSKKYAGVGGHWNRVAVDAIRHGVIPIAQREAMGDELFKPNVHYIPLERGMSPETYAQVVWEAGHNLDRPLAMEMQAAGQSLLGLFDRAYVATQFIDLALGRDIEFEQSFGTTEAGEDQWFKIMEFFDG